MTGTVAEGSKAPGFSIPTDEGTNATLESYGGAPLVLYFYPKDDTSGCTREALDFSALSDAFADTGAAILGVSPDSVEKHAKFRKKHDLSVALGADELKQVLEAYGVWVEKSMYGRKYMGVERSTFLIDANGVIRKVWRKVKVAGHAEEVLQAVQAL